MASQLAKIKDTNVVQLPAKSDKVSDQKWGRSVMKLGFCMIPSLLLRAQQRLGLNPTQLAVLLQLADFWWEAGRKPFPSKQALSERLGLSPRQIQRHLADLESAGLISRIERRALNKGKLSNEYDLSGLVEKLKKIAPEIEEANEIRKQSTRKGGVKKIVLKQETKKPA
ncbi:MarR family transcriptional regulator [Salmonella enterica]|uniref:helix-turn-helix domain-containing protein n=1 Tax=Enterobacter hormaechei TaxID=158836 RepID=UPI001CF6B3BF|nr:MarR family transcriptional regulator [Salmonella enterica]EGX9279863.1 MarR family transcriptional regulator [Salmonella enterica]MCB3349356.1 helix-turn-helix domain-containing protein [Klebsiella pneumoniae]MCP6564824.1 helix-turn-helix domain-containing protein [Klebsiella pneumoniae]HBZ8434534.1 helix-turn-helix domain-containing protein [Klebsiella pneumoniae]